MIRILNIVNNLDGGATEAWLARVCEMARMLRPDWEWTFYCTYAQRGKLDEYVRGLGARIVDSPYRVGNKMAFFLSLRSFLKENPHDILHCHHDFMSAVYLWASLGVPLRKRIVHIHNTDEEIPTSSWWKKRVLHEPMRQTCLHRADNIIGVSHHALSKFLNGTLRDSKRDRVLYCGIETALFEKKPGNLGHFRQSLGLPNDAKILLFVGRMVSIKNPIFALKILEIAVKWDSTIVLCFVGTGVLETELNAFIKQAGLAKHVRMLGWRDDVAQVMKASNLFVFPRIEEPKEALGLVLVEAQAAGLPMLVSKGVPSDAIVVPRLLNILPLADGPESWARQAIKILSMPKPDQLTSLAEVANSPFSMHNSAAALIDLYES